MKWWKRFGLETRADNYAEAVLAHLINQAEGKDAAATESGAVEFASSLVARCFASATLKNVRPAIADLLTPSMMSTIGRGLIRSGECVYLIRSERKGIRLFPASTWQISGEFNPSSWMYKVELAGPDRTATVTVSEDRVLHFKYASDGKRPWSGIGPLSGGRLAARLSAESNTMLADLTSGPRGSLLPLPKNPDSTVDDLIAKMRVLSGGMNIVESQNSGWGDKKFGRERVGTEAYRTVHSRSIKGPSQRCGFGVSGGLRYSRRIVYAVGFGHDQRIVSNASCHHVATSWVDDCRRARREAGLSGHCV